MQQALVKRKPEEKKSHAAPEPAQAPDLSVKAEEGAPAGMPLFLRKAASASPPDSSHPEAPVLAVGRPDDPAEREADSLAERAMSSPGMPGGARPWGLAAREGRGGQPLAESVREDFEPRFGADLSGVRVHTGGGAERSNRWLQARAFTVGSDILFGRGRFQPESGDGRRLIAHELSHVLLGHPGARRQPEATPPAPLGELTNVDFILEMANVRSWLASHGEADPEYAAHVSRRGEIEEERRRRVALGHLWITAELSGSPGQLYQLVQRDGNVTAVVIANAEQVEGVPRDLGGNPIMTPEQFQERLALEHIQTALASALIPQLAVASSFLQPAQPTVGVPREGGGRVSRPFSIVDPATAPRPILDLPVPMTRMGRYDMPIADPLPGYGPQPPQPHSRLTMGELGSGQSARHLVAFDGPNPVVLGTDQFQAAGTMATGGYVVSMLGSGGVGRVMLGERMLRALRMGQTMHHLTVNPNSGPRAGSSAGPDVNAVERFHAEIWRVAGRTGQPPAAGDPYNLNAQEMARVALAFGVNALPEEVAVLGRIAAGDAAAQADLQTLLPRAQAAANRRLQQLMFESQLPGSRQGSLRERAGFNAGRSLVSPFNPEQAAGARLGEPLAAGRSAALGAGLGALLALPVDAGVTLATGGSFENYGERVPRVLATGAFGGGLAGASEQLLVSRFSSSLIARGAGLTGGAAAGMLGARFVPGGIGAAGAELLNIYAFEDRPHSGREVALRTSRAGGIGMISTGVGMGAQAATTGLIGAILTAGGTGAVEGSVVPGWGTAIGFVVGVGASVFVYVVLDRNLPAVDPTVSEAN
jgi:hypothetical protein